MGSLTIPIVTVDIIIPRINLTTPETIPPTIFM